MNSIEEFFRNHRDQLNDAEPDEGHFDRFRYKLERMFGAEKVVRKISIVPYLLKAAVVTLLVTLSSLYVWDSFIRPESRMMTLSDVSPQYREVENYYVSEVSARETEILNLDIMGTPAQKEIMLQEIRNMDSIYVELQKELKAHPNDERVINAMIEHYQTKLNVMSLILDQLKQIRNESLNNTQNESVTL